LDAFEAAHPIPIAERVAELTEQRHAAPLRTSAVAREVGCHPVRLRVLFRERYAMSIRRYQTTCRLRHAANLLLDSNHNIDEIVEQVGFHSRDHFYRAFVKQFGLTPGEYRRTIRNA
jgi:AraC-like DNA-binding protein